MCEKNKVTIETENVRCPRYQVVDSVQPLRYLLQVMWTRGLVQRFGDTSLVHP